MRRFLKLLKIISHSCEQTEKIGENLSQTLVGTEVIALFGELGAGKTAFTRGLCKGLNVKDDVCSPTFAILNEYNGKFKVFHFDMYRVKNVDDLYSTGYFDYLDNGVLVIEWSENVENILPKSAIKLTIKYGKTENERVVSIEGADLNENFGD